MMSQGMLDASTLDPEAPRFISPPKISTLVHAVQLDRRLQLCRYWRSRERRRQVRYLDGRARGHRLHSIHRYRVVGCH